MRNCQHTAHTAAELFAPTAAALAKRLAAIQPADYARTRNALDGAVTRLSPYLTHGFISVREVYAAVAAQHSMNPRHKLVYEFGWREYFQHVWQHRDDAIFTSLHQGPLPDEAYATVMPMDIREARTGVPVIDNAVRTLYATGYLHNHVRMWLASYIVHLRKVHWRAGADWLYAHLLDGDLASNHLSWQWVAATSSAKPYLFNAENVAKYAPQEWHSPGTVIDTTYLALDAIARQTSPVSSPGAAAAGVDIPDLLIAPSHAFGFLPPESTSVDGRDVWLVHPWALAAPPADLPADVVVIAFAISSWHVRWPWSAARWNFVATRQRALASTRWYGSADSLRTALKNARIVATIADNHYGALMSDLHENMVLRPAPRLFKPVDRVCDSFSRWWGMTALDLRQT